MDNPSLKQILKGPNSDEYTIFKFITAKYIPDYRVREKELINSLASKGWTRKLLYDFIIQMLGDKVLYQELSEDEYNALDNFYTAIIGYCHPDCIIKFPGDPQEEEEFLSYVRSDSWKV
ncbi:hypothetical protein [Tellurirhabdus rosea]|uniref:hypothetical protein n=1 Tax=Tellurirhabdus rosea TaxID=2674997 RepID=UPI00224F020B|nr:hypothetical protein [Tellurirhabdus rosea]